jgi:ribosomal protein S18 acetylase RimI-like enzyme
VASGRWAADESLELARGEYAQLLPHGLRTDEQFLLTIVGARGQAVGSLWFGRVPRAGGGIAYVYDLVVRPRHRRRGHATRAFLALEAEVRKLGLVGIALHVFGHNVGAQALYAKLGFQPTNINLFKPIEAAPAAAQRRAAPARRRVAAPVA